MFLAWKRRINAPADRGRDTRALQAYLGHRNLQHGAIYESCYRRGLRNSGANDASRLQPVNFTRSEL